MWPFSQLGNVFSNLNPWHRPPPPIVRRPAPPIGEYMESYVPAPPLMAPEFVEEPEWQPSYGPHPGEFDPHRRERRAHPHRGHERAGGQNPLLLGLLSGEIGYEAGGSGELGQARFVKGDNRG
jgi:hypothetical protein